MAEENVLGRNYVFPIKNADGTPFHDLVVEKSTYDSVIMSLGDKITGDVYYKDNTLAVTMQEYIEYKRNPNDPHTDTVRFFLVNPPTIVREGMVADNGELKGMTKYSFEFYHPMYMLSNFPFTDVAVSEEEELYLAQNKTFAWIGTAIDYVAKLNANLRGTAWEVRISDSLYDDGQPSQKLTTLSEVLSFDKVFVSDALKTFYDTYEIPYIVDVIPDTDEAYDRGKRFVIVVGLPSNEIRDTNNEPFVFQFGQGVGLKNNSRTPKNNKIVTRIAGHGSTTNVPYGYPQIIWTGDANAKFTIGDSAGVKTDVTINGKHYDRAVSYPIYDGIVNGRYVKLIKHPFTRDVLMPTVYVDSVNNKVNPYAADYDSEAQIIDYYDAISDATYVYPNEIVADAPSFELHEFDTIKPELGDVAITGECTPITNDEVDYKTYEHVSKAEFEAQMATWRASFRPEQVMGAILTDIMNAYNNETNASNSNYGGSHTWAWSVRFTNGYCYVSLASDILSFKYAIAYNTSSAPQDDDAIPWDDTMDDDGNYVQSYFKITLPILDFDLYACASITEKMDINMRSGACMGCTFPVMVDWEDYKKNFYDADGMFAPTGAQRDYTRYPDSSQTSVTLIVQKDLNTFGTILPDVFRQPTNGDKFVILGISLPQSYVTNAQTRLDDAMKQYMLDNNVYYYDYPLKFDEHFLATHTNILAQIHPNTIVRFMFAGVQNVLYVKQMTVKFGEGVLPKYDITLTDDVEIVLNKIGQVTEDVSRVRVGLNELQKYYGEGFAAEIDNKLSRVADDIAQGRITFQQGLTSLGNILLSSEIRSSNFSSGLYTGRGWRIDELGNAEVESLRVRSYLEIVEMLINRQQGQEGDTLFSDNDQIESVEPFTYSGTTYYKLSLKEKWEGYVTAQQPDNILRGIVNTLAAKNGNVSDVTEADSVETDGENKYYTSWMKQMNPSDVGTTTEANQIVVFLYGDDQVPAGKNFAPCELMTIARWGCDADPNDARLTPAEKASIVRRQQMFYISASEGRIVKLVGVDKPILRDTNYGTTLGILPDFVRNNDAINERFIDGRDYLYAQGVVVGDFIKVNVNGDPIINYVDKGEWQDNTTYLHNEYDATDMQWETHEVWHNGEYWRCLVHQPYNGVYYEPTDANSTYWEKRITKGESTPVYEIRPNYDKIVIERGTTSTNIVLNANFIQRLGTSESPHNVKVIVAPRALDGSYPTSSSDFIYRGNNIPNLPTDSVEATANVGMSAITIFTYSLNTNPTPSDYTNVWENKYDILVVRDGENGDDGYNKATVRIYRRASTAPAAPTANVTYNFSTGAVSGLSGWSTTIPTTTTYSCWVREATVISRNDTATITPSMWSTAVIFADRYQVLARPSVITLDEGDTNKAITIAANFYSFVDTTRAPYSCYWALFTLSGTTYTRIAAGGMATNISRNDITLSYTDNIDAYVLRISASSMASAAAGTAFLAEAVIPIVRNGKQGEGQIGRSYYYDGEYDATKTYGVTASQAPFVSYVVDGQTRYYVRKGEDGSTTTNIVPTNDTYWDVMTSDFKYLISEAIFTNFAKLGSGVFNEDWMFSQYGEDKVTLWSGSSTRNTNSYIQVGLSDSGHDAYNSYDETLNHFSVEEGKKYKVYVTARATTDQLFLKVNYRQNGATQNTQGLVFMATADTTSKTYTIEFYAEYTGEAFVASYGSGVVTAIVTDGANDYQNMSPTFANLDDVTFSARVLVSSSYTSLAQSLMYGAPIFVIEGKQYTIRFVGRANASGNSVRIYLCQGDTTELASGDWAELTYRTTDGSFSKTFTATYTGYARLRAYNTVSGADGYVNGAYIHAVNPFVPKVAIDWRTGYAHFSGDNVRFNPDGSGKVAGGNINWNTAGDLNVKGKIEATSLGRSMAYYAYNIQGEIDLITILSTTSGLLFASLWTAGDGLPSKIVIDNTGSTGTYVNLPPASNYVGQEIEIFNTNTATFILRGGSSSSGNLINLFKEDVAPTIYSSGRIRILAVEDKTQNIYAWMVLDSDNTSLTS